MAQSHAHVDLHSGPAAAERGVALILVLFIVSLASVLVVSLTYSTHLASRLGAMTERGFEAEYLLKSAVNLARVLIKEDTTPEDGPQDLWGEFSGGVGVPPQLLGLETPNVTVALEIRPEESKIPLRALVPVSSGPPDLKWRELMVRLFRRLGFDDDEEVDHTGLFPGRRFTAEELVAILIDYMDADNDSYAPGDFAAGVEGELPPNTLANARIARIGELAGVPGFTPERLRKLSPFVTVFGNGRININLAPKVVLEVLSPDISEAQVQQIIEYRASKDGPFNEQSFSSVLSEMIGQDTWERVSSMLTVRGGWFQVLSKVDYGNTTYFMRAYVSKAGQKELPEIRSVELF